MSRLNTPPVAGGAGSSSGTGMNRGSSASVVTSIMRTGSSAGSRSIPWSKCITMSACGSLYQGIVNPPESASFARHLDLDGLAGSSLWASRDDVGGAAVNHDSRPGPERLSIVGVDVCGDFGDGQSARGVAHLLSHVGDLAEHGDGIAIERAVAALARVGFDRYRVSAQPAGDRLQSRSSWAKYRIGSLLPASVTNCASSTAGSMPWSSSVPTLDLPTDRRMMRASASVK